MLNWALQCWLRPRASSWALGCSAHDRESGEVKRTRVLRLQSAGYAVQTGGAMEAGAMAWGLWEERRGEIVWTFKQLRGNRHFFWIWQTKVQKINEEIQPSAVDFSHRPPLLQTESRLQRKWDISATGDVKMENIKHYATKLNSLYSFSYITRSQLQEWDHFLVLMYFTLCISAY